MKGGSIGSLGKGKWNYKTCIVEAKKYNTLKDSLNNSKGAYLKALKNKWIADYVWLEDNIRHRRG